jgi:hypothetical protein
MYILVYIVFCRSIKLAEPVFLLSQRKKTTTKENKIANITLVRTDKCDHLTMIFNELEHYHCAFLLGFPKSV